MRKETIPRDKKRSPHLRETGFWNPRNFCLWRPESWALECGKQRKESGIPLTIGIQNPSSTDKESDIQDQESRIQDCLGFCYMGRKKPSVFKVNKFISFRNIGHDKKPEKLNKNQNLPSSLSAA